ncbi:LytTR family transcriptional regulator DNA-binding domain-containing protein [Tenacibaculum sp. ZS6-P6]|uniref:LytTR family transcriptional regulator DNA-binding domain-containing protein n=1 Tax=Tenacibaculum sp. ZS6-P6 TaxID=3447503 RepID=UPI003F94A47C
MNKLNPSIKLHTYVDTFLSLWIFIFTYYIRPFDSGNFGNYLWWEFLSIGFSFITFLSYFIISILQDSIYQRFEKWNIVLEILSILCFLFLNLILTFLYYKSPFLNGIWSFNQFFHGNLKSALIFIPIIIFARNLTLKQLPKQIKETIIEQPKSINKEEKKITIKGEYKLDILKIKKEDLICISKSQNYVEVFFLDQNNINSKLIRSSLKKIHSDFNFLTQVHRSHLINPSHFKSWKNSNTILLTQIEIPVSKSFKNNLRSI